MPRCPWAWRGRDTARERNADRKRDADRGRDFVFMMEAKLNPVRVRVSCKYTPKFAEREKMSKLHV
jgi:hypothetical protein